MRAAPVLLALGAAFPSIAVAQSTSAPASAPAPLADKPPATVSEVVVNAKAPPVQTGIDRRSYSVSSDLHAQSGSAADALRNIPSVEVDPQGNVSLRGDPNVTILIDGKPSTQFQGDNRGPALQQMPASRIERVEVMTNPSAASGADGSGGVINLVTAHAKGPGRSGSLRASVGSGHRQSVSAGFGLNDGPLSLTGDLGLRHDTQKQETGEDRLRPDALTGGFDATRQDGVVHLEGRSANGRLGLDYDLDPALRLSGETHAVGIRFVLGGLSRFRLSDPSGATTQLFDRALDIRQIRTNAGASAGLRRQLPGDGHQFSLNLSYDASNDDRIRSGRTTALSPIAPDAFDQQRLDYRLSQADLKGDYVRPLAQGAVLKAGFDLQHTDNAYNNRGFLGAAPGALSPNAALTNLFEFRQRLDQAYVTWEQPLGAVSVLAGLRVEDVRIDLNQVTQGRVDHNNYVHAYPSLHLAWKLSDTDTASASYSRRVQRPQPEEFNAFRFLLDPLSYRAGNPALRPQQTQSFEFGYERRAGPSLYLATLYYRQNEDVVSDVVRDLGGGVLLNTRENLATTRNGGLELIANRKLSRTVSLNLSGNLFWNEFDPQPLAGSPRRSLVTGFGRANLDWQATPTDFVQFNLLFSGRRLSAQGYAAPTGALNLGWRHKLDDRVALVITAQDALGTARDRFVIDTPQLKSVVTRRTDSRILFAGFTWTFGGGRARDPAFEFDRGTPSQ